jgi:asparagine synthase (glutamine-hydrolysing)
MEDPALDEGRYISAVLAQTGIEGHEVWPSWDELEKIFPRLCYHLEEPFPATSQFAQHLVMRLASEQRVTVLLDGQGADELMAGYKPYFLTRYGDLAERGRLLALWREWRGFRSNHKRAFPLTTKALLARLMPGVYRRFKRDEANGSQAITTWPDMTVWWNRDWLGEFADERPTELVRSKRDNLTRKLYQDAMRGELQELLRYGDRNSMAHSREVRQPFLDHRIAEFLFALPPEHKLFRGETKIILREAIKGLVPDCIVNRQDKLGYQAPLASWLKGTALLWAEDRFDQLGSEFSGRAVSGGADRFRALVSRSGEQEAQRLFSILTLAECARQLRRTRLSLTPAS